MGHNFQLPRALSVWGENPISLLLWTTWEGQPNIPTLWISLLVPHLPNTSTRHTWHVPCVACSRGHTRCRSVPHHGFSSTTSWRRYRSLYISSRRVGITGSPYPTNIKYYNSTGTAGSSYSERTNVTFIQQRWDSWKSLFWGYTYQILE